MAGSFVAFTQDELEQKYGAGYNEFLRRRGMSLGIYKLPAGATDTQHPHMAQWPCVKPICTSSTCEDPL